MSNPSEHQASADNVALQLGAPHWAELNDLAVIELRGPDVKVWLQGQATQDVSRLEPGDSVYSLFVSPQGKVQSDAWIHAGELNWKIVLPAAVRAELLERFERYIVMEDVSTAASDELVLHVAGTASDAVIKDFAAPAWPAARLGQPGFDVLVVPEVRVSLLEQLAQRCVERGGKALSESEWEALRISNAVARFGKDFDASNFGQEAGLNASAVSFTKGCYLGQEPVAMLQHRGKTKKQLCLLQTSNPALTAQNEIQNADGARLGVVTSTHWFEEKQYALALGYVQRTALEQNATLLVNGTPLQRLRTLGESR